MVSSAHILLVHPDPERRKYFTDALGSEVVCVASPAEAEEQARQGTYTLLAIPPGAGARDVVRRVTEILPDIAAVFLGARSHDLTLARLIVATLEDGGVPGVRVD